jgi:outer membrane lipoprotein-sorting protein
MRKLLISTVIVAFAICSVQAQNLDQILNDLYKASGQEKMAEIKTIVTSGTMTYVTAGMESSITMYQARPNNFRAELDIMGSKVIQTYNGTTAWMYGPAMGIAEPQEMGAEEIKAALQQFQFESPLWKYKEKGSTVELAGSSDDGSAYKVKMTQKDGESMIFLIDKKSSLITGFISVSVMGGAEAELNVSMKGYKAVNGIQNPHYISTKMDGEVMMTMVIESVEYDKDIDPALFEKPVVE